MFVPRIIIIRENYNLSLLTRKTKMYPLKFEPILKQTLWGGDKIIPFKHLNDQT